MMFKLNRKPTKATMQNSAREVRNPKTVFKQSRDLRKHLEYRSMLSQTLADAYHARAQQYIATDSDDIDSTAEMRRPFDIFENEILFENQSVGFLTVPPETLRDKVEATLMSRVDGEKLLEEMAAVKLDNEMLEDELAEIRDQEDGDD